MKRGVQTSNSAHRKQHTLLAHEIQ